MSNKRISYEEKYRDLPKRWNIDKAKTKELLDRYLLKLVEEICSEEPFRINKYFRDYRTKDEYIYDLLDGMLIEELVCLWFSEQGCNAKRVGCDANGKIIRSGPSRITTKPDIVVNDNYLEIQISRKGRLNQYHIKKNKGNRILAGQNKLMFVVGDEYFIVGAKDIDESAIEINQAFGGKETYVIRPTERDYKRFKDKNVYEIL